MRARALLLVLVASVGGTAACEIKTASAPSAPSTRPATGMTAPSASSEPASSTSPPSTKVE